MKSKEKLKLYYIKGMRFFLKALMAFPIKNNRIIFESFSGSSYSCNPKYISMELEKYGKDFEIIWALKNPEILSEDIKFKVCKYRSLKHAYYKLTSKVYISNFLEATEHPKRKGQIYIQTWHGGGCYKKLGNKGRESSAHDIRRDIQIKETDYFVSSSDFFEKEVIGNQLGYTNSVLRTGMPRNDILFRADDDELKKMVCQKIGIDYDTMVVLYAPTWNQYKVKYEPMNVKLVSKALENKFGKKVTFLFRSHVNDTNKLVGAIDVSDYNDMQELLVLADILLTDYSSSIWDFSFTYKPCFLFAPDVDYFIKKRGFGRDIESWGVSLSRNNEELCEAIAEFDENDFKKKMIKHHCDLGSCETGKAAEIIANKIMEESKQ